MVSGFLEVFGFDFRVFVVLVICWVLFFGVL